MLHLKSNASEYDWDTHCKRAFLLIVVDRYSPANSNISAIIEDSRSNPGSREVPQTEGTTFNVLITVITISASMLFRVPCICTSQTV